MNCERCGNELPGQSGKGRKRKYCRSECRHGIVKTENICKHCGVKMDGRQRTFCNEQCCREWHNNERAASHEKETRQCVVCGTDFETEKTSRRIVCSDTCSYKRGREQSKDRLKANPKKLCLHCGGPVLRNGLDKRHKNGANNFCSHKCYADYRSSLTPVCPGCGRHHQGNESELCCDCKKSQERIQTPKQYVKKCIECGAEFVSKNNTTLRCSSNCTRIYNNRFKVEHYQSTALRTNKTCNCCGKEFLSSNANNAYCSVECSASAERLINKARNRIRMSKTRIRSDAGCRYDPISVKRLWIRDGGRCALCGKAVDIKLPRGGPGKRPDMMCATRDHIVPISHGGEHTWENVQLAHFICNSRRQDGGNVQALLFG